MVGVTTQRITAKDIEGGRIRIPIDAQTRVLLLTRESLRIDLRGRLLDARWDPRLGPDKERSGVLAVGREVLGEARAARTSASLFQRVGEVVRLG